METALGAVAPRDQIRFAYARGRTHLISMPRSYERLRAEIDAVVRQYRAHCGSDLGRLGLTRAEAVKRIRQLGFTENDANRWLGPKPATKCPRLIPK